MNKKKTQLGSIVGLRCPHCHATSMFENPSTYSFKDLGPVKEKCDECGTNLKPESGFYFGAAYASYGITVAMWISIVVILKTLDAFGIIQYAFLSNPLTLLVTGIVCTLVFFPYIFRLSRSIWAHMFIKSMVR